MCILYLDLVFALVISNSVDRGAMDVAKTTLLGFSNFLFLFYLPVEIHGLKFFTKKNSPLFFFNLW